MQQPGLDISLPPPALSAADRTAADLLARKATRIPVEGDPDWHPEGAGEQPPGEDEPATGLPGPAIFLGRDRPDGPLQFAYPVPGYPEWLACGTLTPRDGLLEIRELRFVPVVESAVVTGGLLRAVKITPLTTAAEAELALTAGARKELATTFGIGSGPAEPDSDAKPAGQGRPRIPQALLREIAEAFLAEQGKDGDIYERIAGRLEQAHGGKFSQPRVRNGVARAEGDGWITRGKSGSRAHRSAGPRLKEAREREQLAR